MKSHAAGGSTKRQAKAPHDKSTKKLKGQSKDSEPSKVAGTKATLRLTVRDLEDAIPRYIEAETERAHLRESLTQAKAKLKETQEARKLAEDEAKANKKELEDLEKEFAKSKVERVKERDGQVEGIRHGQYNLYKGGRKIMKELKALRGDVMEATSQQPSDGTLSYGAWTKACDDFEDITSSAEQSLHDSLNGKRAEELLTPTGSNSSVQKGKCGPIINQVVDLESQQVPKCKSAPKFVFCDSNATVDLLCADLHGLQDEAWFTTGLFDLYSLYLNRVVPLKAIENGLMKKQYHVCDIFFYKQLLVRIEAGDMNKLEKMGTWTDLKFKKDQIYLFIPIHDEDRRHFSLAVIYRAPKNHNRVTMLHLDSIRNPDASKVYFDHIELFLKEGLKVKGTIKRSIPEVPQQGNGYDCGVDTLYNAQRMITMGAPKDLKDLENKLSESSHGRQEIKGLREFIDSLVQKNKLKFIPGDDGCCNCADAKAHAILMSKIGALISKFEVKKCTP